MSNAQPNDALTIDLNDLTIEEIEIIEDIVDAPFDALSKPGAKKGRFLRALAYVSRRRTDPDFTLEDAGRLKVSLAEDSADPSAPSEQ
jgi:hypothetical protein